MRGRNIAAIIVGVLLLGVVGLCGLTAYGSYAWLRAHDRQVRIFEFATEWAEIAETRRYEITAPLELEIETDSGDITLIAEQRANVEVEIVKKAWGETQEEAQAAAAGIAIEELHEGGRLSLQYIQPQNITVAGTRGGPDRVSFTVRAPAELAATLTAGQGEVRSTGASGPLEIATRFGNVVVRDHTGSVDLRSDYGNMELQDVEAGPEDAVLAASFGDMQLSNVAGADFVIEVANGRCSIQGLEASGRVTVSNQFGDLEILDVRAASLQSGNQNGKISIERGELDGGLEANNRFGDITITQVAAARYNLQTNNGDLVLDGAQGALKLENAFGDILIENTTEAILDLKTENGNITFTGGLDESAAHTIQNSFGNITLAFPAESAFDIQLKTEFGQIRSELPLTLTGDLSETDWQGALNGGGPLLSATTNNGNITLLAAAVGN